mmetsp:Transcript_127399/g.271600  ORF Transcript_127399/g.271600 Transcript_127399/m.271600 type:complete len:357 (+) Transcript_127399:177-1247(+)
MGGGTGDAAEQSHRGGESLGSAVKQQGAPGGRRRKDSGGNFAGDQLLHMLQGATGSSGSNSNSIGVPSGAGFSGGVGGFGGGGGGSFGSWAGGSWDAYAAQPAPLPPMPAQAPAELPGHGSLAGMAQMGPSPPEGNALKELLAQVAPQAVIRENSSQLATKASARILGKMMGASAAATTMGGQSGAAAWINGADAEEAQAWFGDRPSGPEGNFGGADSSGKDSSKGSGNGGRSKSSGEGYHEDDEDNMFLQKWSGLFSKGSPLVEGTATDPFKDDLRRRAKVVWKKNRDRPGHHSRYQERRQKRAPTAAAEEEEQPKGWTPGAREGEAGAAVSVVFDASSKEESAGAGTGASASET